MYGPRRRITPQAKKLVELFVTKELIFTLESFLAPFLTEPSSRDHQSYAGITCDVYGESSNRIAQHSGAQHRCMHTRAQYRQSAGAPYRREKRKKERDGEDMIHSTHVHATTANWLESTLHFRRHLGPWGVLV
mmetsp:Transcript_39648/g.64312  ORF Transcript_39648/g.64312 Transcript_39648/m.64312 type:complete len:133 (-) Transcript_39648:1764-2162(-)